MKKLNQPNKQPTTTPLLHNQQSCKIQAMEIIEPHLPYSMLYFLELNEILAEGKMPISIYYILCLVHQQYAVCIIYLATNGPSLFPKLWYKTQVPLNIDTIDLIFRILKPMFFNF